MVRGDCVDGPRPCPYATCRHHLFGDLLPGSGNLRQTFPGIEPWEMQETCSLDVAERDGATLEEVGKVLNLTRERVRQIEEIGLQRLRRRIGLFGGELAVTP